MSYKLTTSLDASELQSPHQLKTWAFVFDSLSCSSSPLLLRVLDTLVFRLQPWSPCYWIFTDKDHFVRKRGISKLRFQDIVQACVQSLNSTGLSMQDLMVIGRQKTQPKACERKVCFLVAKKTRKQLTLAGLWSLRKRKDLCIEVLQMCYMAGRPFDSYVYYHSLSLVPRSSVVSKRVLESLFAEETVCGEEEVRRRIEEATQAVLGVLETHQAVQVVYLRLSYLVEQGKFQAESRVPWLMFAEECIIGASNRNRPIQLHAEPAVRPNRTPSLLKPRFHRQITSLHTSFLPDPQLSIVTLASIHHSQTHSTKHKSTQEILADVRKRQSRYRLYRSLQVLPAGRGTGRVSAQSNIQTLGNAEESVKRLPEPRERRRKEVETNTSAEEMAPWLSTSSIREENRAKSGLKRRLSSGHRGMSGVRGS